MTEATLDEFREIAHQAGVELVMALSGLSSQDSSLRRRQMRAISPTVNRGCREDLQMNRHDRRATRKFRQAAELNDRAFGLMSRGQLSEALRCCDEAVAIYPSYADAHANRAILLGKLNRIQEGFNACNRALGLHPHHHNAMMSRGLALHELHRFDEALVSFKKAGAQDPKAHFGMAQTYLLTGELDRGWLEMEWRWKLPGERAQTFSRPLWLGEGPIEGKTILLHCEQGLGDTIQFCRYVPMVAALGARVILAVQPELKSILAKLEGVSVCLNEGDQLPSFDVHCPLMSLPLAFKTTPESIPTAPYLECPSRALRGTIASSLVGLTDDLQVGVVWSGNSEHTNDMNRSIAFSAMRPLLDVPATLFFALNKEIRPADALEPQRACDSEIERPGKRSKITNLSGYLKSFSEAAQVISKLDLVITVDTSVAHLAGALGKPVWILLPFVPDWRWMLYRQDSPWYPSAELFRQGPDRQWGPVIERVRNELARLPSAPMRNKAL